MHGGKPQKYLVGFIHLHFDLISQNAHTNSTLLAYKQEIIQYLPPHFDIYYTYTLFRILHVKANCFYPYFDMYIQGWPPSPARHTTVSIPILICTYREHHEQQRHLRTVSIPILICTYRKRWAIAISLYCFYPYFDMYIQARGSSCPRG